MCLLFTLIGSCLIGDWQSLIHDNPCTNNSSLGTASGDWNSDFALHLGEEMYPATFETVNCSNFSVEHSSFNERVDACECLSTDDNICYWNQQSGITGKFCNTCLPACLSTKATLNFHQFIAGTFLLSLAAPLAFVVTSALASDIAPAESQVSALGNGFLFVNFLASNYEPPVSWWNILLFSILGCNIELVSGDWGICQSSFPHLV